MSTAYVDTSVLTAIAFDEPGAEARARRLENFTRLISSNLLEAELRAALAREDIPFQESMTARIDWVLPDRPLAFELATILDKGYLRGADLWHVATALHVSPGPGSLYFATLDARQSAVAQALGFTVPWEAARRLSNPPRSQ